jgi:putative FmdB family regulatory protein
MPTYQYRCTECGEDLEVVQSFHDDALTVCPNCQGKLRKVFSPIGIAFKGSGFYKTDNRSSASIPPGKSSSDGAKKDGASSDGKSGESSGNGSSTSSSESSSGSSGKESASSS